MNRGRYGVSIRVGRNRFDVKLLASATYCSTWLGLQADSGIDRVESISILIFVSPCALNVICM